MYVVNVLQVYHLDVEPLADRLVLFSSQWLEHEAGTELVSFLLPGAPCLW